MKSIWNWNSEFENKTKKTTLTKFPKNPKIEFFQVIN